MGNSVSIVAKLLRSPSNLQRPQQYTVPLGACGDSFAYTRVANVTTAIHNLTEI